MDKNPSENDDLKAIREQKERPLLDAFQGSKVWFHEKYLLFETTVNIETDAWGARITLSSIAHPTFTISGRWDMINFGPDYICLLYTSPSPRDLSTSRMPSSA